MDTWAQILQIVRNRSALENATTLGNGDSSTLHEPLRTPRLNSTQSLGGSLLSQGASHPLIEAFQGGSIDHSALSQAVANLSFLAPETSNIPNFNYPGAVATGVGSQYHSYGYRPELQASILRFLSDESASSLLPELASSLFPLGANPRATPQLTGFGFPVSEHLSLASPIASVGVDASTVLASTASPNTGVASSTTPGVLRESMQPRKNEKRHHKNQTDPSSSGTTIHTSKFSLRNNGSAQDIITESANYGPICKMGVDRKEGLPETKTDTCVARTEVTCPDSETLDESTPAVNAIMLPCRARGMPKDHNFSNAHFIIPPGLRHGEDMICSHSKCRNSGIKFRYCASCRLPVAKRNFHQRHSHGLKSYCSNDSANSSVASMDNASADHDQAVATNSNGQTEKIPKNGKRIGAAAAAPPTNSSLHNEEARSQRRRLWNDLLERRPVSSDSTSMSAWLLEVIAVSETDAPQQHPNKKSTELLNSAELLSFLSQNGVEPVEKTASEDDPTRPRHRISSDQQSVVIPSVRQLSSKRQRQGKEQVPDKKRKSIEIPK